MMKTELKKPRYPTEPMPNDVKIEMNYLKCSGLSPDEAFRECKKLVDTGKSDYVSSESAASWIVKFENVFAKAMIEHWNLDDPPKYWTGDDN